MSRTRKFLANIISRFILQVVVLFSGLIIPRLMLVTYGSEINGLVTSISQFVRYFSLVEAGLAGATIYALYKPLADNDFEAINGVVSAARRFYLQTGLIFLFLLALCTALYPCFVKTEHLSPLNVGSLVLIIGCSGILNFFVMAKYQTLVTADQRVYVINLLQAVSTVVNTVIIFILTKQNVNIVTLRTIALISVFLPPAVLSFYVKRNYVYLNYKAKPDKDALNKRWDALILQILGMVQVATPVVLITFFGELAEVSVYAIYNMVIMGVQQVMGIFGSGLSASFGELIALKDKHLLKKVYNCYEFGTYFLLTFFCSATMVLLLPFVKIYTKGITDTNYNQPLTAVLFVLNTLLYSIKHPQGTLVTSAGLFKETRYQTLTQALIGLVLGVILTYLYGIAGVLTALIIANVYRDIDLIIFIPKRLDNVMIRTTLKRVGLLFVEFVIISFTFYKIDVNVSCISEWILLAMAVCIYSFIIIFIFSLVFDKDALYQTIQRLRTMLRGKYGR